MPGMGEVYTIATAPSSLTGGTRRWARYAGAGPIRWQLVSEHEEDLRVDGCVGPMLRAEVFMGTGIAAGRIFPVACLV